jgi:hypothetical protein
MVRRDARGQQEEASEKDQEQEAQTDHQKVIVMQNTG